jgi:molybdopterin-guanine dinucleotide biosynthesis protein A
MHYILDANTYKGPFNGLLSAHLKFPQAAWLVVACDLPLIDTNALVYLLERRNPTAFATAFATRKTGLPEPLAALWEPHGLKAAVEHMKTAESSCPRKFLIHTETTLVYPEDDLWLANANEPGDYEELLTKIKQG